MKNFKNILKVLLFALPISVTAQTSDIVCDDQFSNKADNYFCNYYIDAKGDSTFYCTNPCVMVQGISNPAEFRRKFKSGLANGDYRVYEKSKQYTTIIDATFKNGYINQGSILEMFTSTKKHFSGQYYDGKPFGIWLFYHANGQLKQMITYDDYGKHSHTKNYK